MDYKPPETRKGILVGLFPDDDLSKIVNSWKDRINSNYDIEKRLFRDEIKKLDSTFAEIASALQNNLNNQNKFVFPGNGTFDMQDPVFSEKGDLMLGLSYR